MKIIKAVLVDGMTKSEAALTFNIKASLVTRIVKLASSDFNGYRRVVA